MNLNEIRAAQSAAVDAARDDLINKLDDAFCPEAFIQNVNSNMGWLRNDLEDIDDLTAVYPSERSRIINRHMARTLCQLQDARCAKVWLDCVRMTFFQLRKQLQGLGEPE